MSGANLCRLCVNICKDYRNLYDENGLRNETYKTTVKYFDPMFLNVDQGNHLTVLCLICWRHITEFHRFQQSVLLAQAQLLEDDKVAATLLESHLCASRDIICGDFTIKQEKEFIPDVSEQDVLECSATRKSNETSEIFHDIIVKEEVAVENEELCKNEEKCNNDRVSNDIVNNNLFVTDEAELVTLVKSTPKISFSKCVYKTEPLGDEGMSTNDSEANLTAEVADNDDDVLMDISKYELQSIDAEHSEGYDDTLLTNYKPKLRRKSEDSNDEKSHQPKLVGTSGKLPAREDASTTQDETHINPALKRKRHESIQSSTEAKRKPVATKASLNYSLETKNSFKSQSIKRKREEELDDIIVQWKSNLECLICSETCPTYTLLQDHFTQQHPSKECYILCCGLKLKRRGSVAEHVSIHIDSNAFKCRFCSKRCTRKRNLRYHILKQHGVSQENHTNVSSSNKDDATIKVHSSEDHQIVDKGDFSENDDIIAQSFKCIRKVSENQPQRKLAQQESDDMIAKWMPNLECAACEESCASFTLLHEHFRHKHPNGDGYVLCCQRKFCRRTKFQEHIRIHLDPEAFECKVCGKFLTSKLNLKHHMAKLHSAAKDQSLETHDILNKASNDYSETKTTESNNKSNKRKTFQELDDIIAKWRPNLECVMCNDTSPSFTLLQQHFATNHPDARCYITCCQLKFTGRHDFEAHIRYHNDPNAFKCDFCGRCFTSGRNLYRHVRCTHS